MAIRKLPALLALLAVVVLGGADDPAKGQKQKDKDPQATYEPRSRPGLGQKFLEKFVGDWDVQKSFYPRSGEPFRVKGECRQEMTHDGRFLKSEFTFGSGAARTTGTGTIGFETDSGKFTSVWVDSRSTRMSFRQGPEKFNGEEIVLLGKSLGEGSETRKSRTVTRLEDEGRKIVHRQNSIDAEGKERLVMELVMTRKAAKP
jgi:hypothetical protein